MIFSNTQTCSVLQIGINFLQVIAAAAIINMNWTDWMRSLLFAAGAFLFSDLENVSSKVCCVSQTLLAELPPQELHSLSTACSISTTILPDRSCDPSSIS